MPAIPVSWVTPPFSLSYCPTFLLDQFTQHFRLPQPILFLGHPRPASFFGHPWPILFFPSFLHFHGLLLNSLGSPSPIATSFSFGIIGLQTNLIYQFFSLGSSDPFFAFFLFLMILMGLLHHSGVSLACLLSLEPLCYFVGSWTIIPAIQVQWFLLYYFFSSPFFFHIIGFLMPLGPFAKKRDINNSLCSSMLFYFILILIFWEIIR